jgi:hypothetical protein
MNPIESEDDFNLLSEVLAAVENFHDQIRQAFEHGYRQGWDNAIAEAKLGSIVVPIRPVNDRSYQKN